MLSTWFMHTHPEQQRWMRPNRPSPLECWHELEAERGTNGRDAALDAIARRYLVRLLGHPPTRRDAALLPGIDVSDL
jgi:hypothetical protein